MKKIIHVDMDAFYASVEVRDNPTLAELPIAVGGESDRRGVIATCNYVARTFGVRSAMATATAQRLCPQLVLIPGRMKVYQEVSAQIRKIFERYTHKIEPLSLDEAYLDVTDCELFHGSATLIAEDIRRSILQELNLTASAGVASCKFLAKIASDENKPNGLFVVTPDKQDAYVRKLPLSKIPGVGKVTQQKLQLLNLHTCDDIREFDKTELLRRFGKFGQTVWDRSHGIDERELSLMRTRKSIGVEETFAQDLTSEHACIQELPVLLKKLGERYQKHRSDLGIKTNGIKLKFSDFQTTTVETQSTNMAIDTFELLCKEAVARSKGRGIRLIGLTLGLLPKQNVRQIEMDL